MWKEKTKACKKCGGTDFVAVKRKNALSGKPYTTRRCRTCTRKTQREYNERKGFETMRAWQQTNKEHLREYQRQYYKDKYRERNALYDSRIRERTYGDVEKIKEIYNNRPEGFHVDHIVPLNGKNVSGLHVWYNLQYLPATKNLRKSNKF